MIKVVYLQSNPCEFDLDGAMAAFLESDFLSLLELKMEDLDLFGLADSSVAAAAAAAGAALSTVTPSVSFAAEAGLAGSRTAPFSITCCILNRS